MKSATPTKSGLRLGLIGAALTAWASWSPPATAGEGTIPLRVTGRVMGEVQNRHVLDAPVQLRALKEIPAESLKCLTGMAARRYLAQGNIEVFGSVHKILALCIKDDNSMIEVFTSDPVKDRIYRIIGRIRK